MFKSKNYISMFLNLKMKGEIATKKLGWKSVIFIKEINNYDQQ